MTTKPYRSPISNFFRASRKQAFEPDYEKMFIQSKKDHHQAVFDLAEACNHINILKEQLEMTTNGLDRNGNPIRPTNAVASGKLDIPVDLGDGTIVLISGMPGRPSEKACERLCKIIMSFAFTPSTKTPSKNIQEALIQVDPSGHVVGTTILKADDLHVFDDSHADAANFPNRNPQTIKPAPLGSKATQVASPNPDV